MCVCAHGSHHLCGFQCMGYGVHRFMRAYAHAFRIVCAPTLMVVWPCELCAHAAVCGMPRANDRAPECMCVFPYDSHHLCEFQCMGYGIHTFMRAYARTLPIVCAPTTISVWTCAQMRACGHECVDASAQTTMHA